MKLLYLGDVDRDTPRYQKRVSVNYFPQETMSTVKQNLRREIERRNFKRLLPFLDNINEGDKPLKRRGSFMLAWE
jgi:hypothetical protein